jgi:hypothetical protein
MEGSYRGIKENYFHAIILEWLRRITEYLSAVSVLTEFRTVQFPNVR